VTEPQVEIAEYGVRLHSSLGKAGEVRVAHISDLHFRRWDAVSVAAQSQLLALDYDLLVATGDFGNFRRHWRSAADLTKRFFDPLVERGEVFAVLGNHDDPRIASAADMPLTFLRNESRLVHTPGGTIRLAGVDQFTKGAESLKDAFADTGDDEPVVLLAHYPSTAFRLEKHRVDLVLSGHTHGGQIRLPRVGCIWPNDRIPRALSQGLHAVNGTNLHVSPGIGTSLPLRVRINCPAQIAILTLTNAVITPENHLPRRAEKSQLAPIHV